MKNNLKTRLIKNLSANAIGQIIGAIIQLVSVPLFIQSWGVELYGEWLIISAIPSWLAMSDIGFASVAANEMTMEVAKDNRSEALDIFQSTALFINGVSSIIIIVILLVIWFMPIEDWLNLKLQSHYEVIGVVLLLSVSVLVGLQGSLLSAGFRCEGNYALGAFIANIFRLIEYGLLSAAAYFGATPLVAALIFLIARGMAIFYMWLNLCKRSPWIVYGYDHARLATVKRLAVPAVAFMGFPLGNAFNNQGMVTIVAVILGPNAVVVFSTLRTLSRVGWQVMNTINNAVWPEISAAYGVGDLELARKLHRRSCQASLWLAVIAVTGLLFTGDWIIKVWTQGKVSIDSSVFVIMLVVIIANSIWLTSSVVMVATNKHKIMAFYYITGTVLSLLLAIWLTSKIGLKGTALSGLFTDLLMMLYVVKKSLFLLQDNFRDFLKVVAVPPRINLFYNR